MTQPEFSVGLEIVPANDNHGFYIVDGGGLSVCDFYFRNTTMNGPAFYEHNNAKANAHLFRTAPELYEATESGQQLLDWLSNAISTASREWDEGNKDAWRPLEDAMSNGWLASFEDTFKPALAKARGKQ